VGGELLRLALFHPEMELHQVSSESQAGRRVSRTHPHLRRVTDLSFCSLADLTPCDHLFVCLPHGEAAGLFPRLRPLAPRMVDLSADFRLRSASSYEKWYGKPHPAPDVLDEFVYGIPELHRERMRGASLVSGAGCNATATLLALHPIYAAGLAEAGRTVVEVKAGTSQAGASASRSSHHPERSGAVRTYRATGHRHVGEVHQELGLGDDDTVHFTATSIEMVRGVQCVAHVFLTQPLEEREIWKLYRRAYGQEPFVRIIKESSGDHRLPDPHLLAGSNFCDVGFERDPDSRRLVVVSALDNLMKGAAGQAVQAFNLMHGFDERSGLEFPGLFPA
jgi:N-acetyl-gamma-glutamyl-phosphate/LysW-gamma-L-alpha-aminoadipyl-6-phosphate reductase